MQESAFLYYCGSLDEFNQRVQPFIKLKDDKRNDRFHESQVVKYFTKDDAFAGLIESNRKRLVNKLEKLQRSLSVPKSSEKNQSGKKHKRRESFSSRIMLDLDSFEHDMQTFPFLCAVLGDFSHFDEQILSRFYDQKAVFKSNFEEEYVSWIHQDIISNSLRAFRLKYDKNVVVSSISCGNSYCIILTESGRLFSWGNHESGKLGLGFLGEDALFPVLIHHTEVDPVEKVVCGWDHSIALSRTGNLYLWGSGKNYKLGNQWKDDVWDYKNGLLDFCDHEGIVQIACGYDFSGFLDKSGSIYMWGGNYFGQLGLGDQNIRSRPTRVNTFRDNVKVESIDFGAFHCVCASSEGEVYSWGFNNMGQLGNGTCLNQMQPKLIYRLNGKKVKRIMCSGSSSIFLTASAYSINESYFSTPDPSIEAKMAILDSDTLPIQLNFPKNVVAPKVNSMVVNFSPTFGKLVLRRARKSSSAVDEDTSVKFSKYIERLHSDLLQQDIAVSLSGLDDFVSLDDQLKEHVTFWRNHKFKWRKGVHSAEIKEKVLSFGIPSLIRDEIWSYAIGDCMEIDLDSLDFTNVAPTPTDPSLAPLYHVIDVDLKRTFPTFSYFHENSPMRDRLRRVLLKFSLEYPKVGYVQGMSYLSGYLFLHMDMKQTFVALATLVNSKFLVDFVLLKREKIHSWSKMFDEMVKFFLPKLYSQFMPYDLFADMFLIEWFITLYAKFLSLDVVAHVWDCFFVFGEFFLFQVGIGILKALEKVLLPCALEDFCHNLRYQAKFLTDAMLFSHIPPIERFPKHFVDAVQSSSL